MTEHISGPLYWERLGKVGRPMSFVHPNPYERSAWLFQMAHFSTWFQTVAADLPGFGWSRLPPLELHKRIAGLEHVSIEGAGYACCMEKSWEVDAHIVDFLPRHDLFP